MRTWERVQVSRSYFRFSLDFLLEMELGKDLQVNEGQPAQLRKSSFPGHKV
jgi:hypothetical protein